MKILLAADGTAQSEAATKTVARFKLSDGDEIKIVTVIDMAVPSIINSQPEFMPTTTAEIEQIAHQSAEKVLETTKARVRGIVSNENIQIYTEILFGSPDSRIVETAEEMNADLIIVGSHGYNRWERLLLGSVSDSVVRHAPCSVLVVRSAKGSSNAND